MRLGLVALLAVAGSVTAEVVEFDLHRLPGINVGTVPQLSGRSTVERRATYTQRLFNNITGGAYFVDVAVGTPPQQLSMVIDTGSSDAWILSSSADICVSAELQRKYFDSCGATYDNFRSGTYKLVERNGFSIRYVDNTTALGDYITDDFSIAGTTVKNLQMGYVKNSVRGTGILGIGYSANVATRKRYPNIMDQFIEQKLISVKAYSLWLNDRRSTSGSLLFGGIDTNKFFGRLHVVPVLKPANQLEYTAFEVSFTNLALTFSNGTTIDTNPTFFQSTVVPAILDSGATLSYLPPQIANNIFRRLGAVTETVETGLTFIDCKWLTEEPNLTINFSFNGTTVFVPVREMVLDTLSRVQHLLPDTIPYERACMFGIQTTAGLSASKKYEESSYALLGDTFLRSAYVVYDLTHNQLGIAQANLNSTESAIVELQAGSNSLPSITGLPEPSRTVGVATVTVTEKNASPGGMRREGGREALSVLAIATVFALLGSALIVS